LTGLDPDGFRPAPILHRFKKFAKFESHLPDIVLFLKQIVDALTAKTAAGNDVIHHHVFAKLGENEIRDNRPRHSQGKDAVEGIFPIKVDACGDEERKESSDGQ
jgi:hypothetical protein